MTAPELIAGRYRLVRRIATGGMGSVWEAWDELLRRPVAVKQLLLQPSISSQDAELARSRVIREARITARLHHPHAVALYDVVEHHGQPCLIMQYVPARNLNQLLKERETLDEPVVARIGSELASALAAAHEVGILHRDVKPSNVLIAADGAAKLTDFGISHAAGDVSLTSTGMITGTPAYLAPEVARGEKSGFPADVFSLGATMYAALEGTPPFGTDENPMALLHKVGSGRISPPRRSSALTAIVLRMLAIEPAARPSMAEVARALSARPAPGTVELPASEGMTVGLPPHTIRDWPADHGHSTAVGPAALDAALPARINRARARQATAGRCAAGRRSCSRGSGRCGRLPAYCRRQQHTARRTLPSLRAGQPWPRAGRPRQSPVRRRPAARLPRPRWSRSPPSVGPAGHPAGGFGFREGDARTRHHHRCDHDVDPHRRQQRSAPRRLGRCRHARRARRPPRRGQPLLEPRGLPLPPRRPAPNQASPTTAELAGAITDYYALMPSGGNQSWDLLTANFQSTTAQDRGYYQRFWSGVSRVTAEDVQGAAPDKARGDHHLLLRRRSGGGRTDRLHARQGGRHSQDRHIDCAEQRQQVNGGTPTRNFAVDRR